MAHAPVIFVSYISHGCPGVQGSRASYRDSLPGPHVHWQFSSVPSVSSARCLRLPDVLSAHRCPHSTLINKRPVEKSTMQKTGGKEDETCRTLLPEVGVYPHACPSGVLPRADPAP